jgi:glycosyltransferase involved in cell wall biosynthesis
VVDFAPTDTNATIQDRAEDVRRVTSEVHVLFFTEDFPETRRAAGGLRVSIRRQAEGLAERCRVTVVVFRRVFPPLRRYETNKILGMVGEGLNCDEESREERRPEPGAGGEQSPASRLRVVHYSYLHIPILWPITEPLQILTLGLWALFRHARDADLLHGHCIYAMGVPAVFLGKLIRRRSVSTAYGTDLYQRALKRKGPMRWWARRVLNGATRVVAVSQSLIKTIASLGVGEDRRRLVPSGVDTGRFRPPADLRSLRHELGLPPEAHVFLSVNMFWPVKGHAVLIEAFRRLSERRPECYLVMTADGPLRPDIAAQAARAGLSDRVRFTGLLDHDAIPLWVAAADALVLPSLNEGMPLSVLEGFACGKPVVGTTVGGIPELVTDERFGILVAPSDPGAFATAMEEAMDRTWDTALLRSRAVEFGWPRVIDKLVGVYQEIARSSV